jgi:glycosyltransferase involved in cell wall biosynthesis
MTPPITLVVSIDTDEDNWLPARTGITVENIRELPRLHRMLVGLGVRPTYFATYQVAIRPWAAEILREVCASGTGEVGAHLNAWNTPPLDEAPLPRNTMLCNLPQALQAAKIATLTDALHAGTGQRPQSFRAGRWGFGQSTAAAVLECGYRVDSSVTPFQSWACYDDGPSNVGAPLDVYRLDGRGDPRVPRSDGPLVEVPVSSGYDRGSIRSWARLQAILDRPYVRRLQIPGIASRLGLIRHVTLNPEMESVDDMLVVSRQLIAQGVRQLHMTWHSASLSPGLTPFVATPTDSERLYAGVATYLDRLGALTPLRFATVGEGATTLVEPATPAASTERRLIVISYHHPPDGAIGGMRWAGLTKYLRPLGWKSWIVTAAAQTPTTNGSATVVVSCPPRTTLNDRYRRFRLRGSAARTAVAARVADASQSRGGDGPLGGDTARTAVATPVADASESHRGVGLLAQLRLEAALLLSLPDEGRGWVLRAAARARKLIRELKPDVVVSTGPPHSAHVVAWLATWGLPTRRIVDLRDPWAGRATGAWRRNPLYRNHLSPWLNGCLERLVVSKASVLLCNTSEFARLMRWQYPRATVEWLPNGVDAQLLPIPAEPLAGLGLVYIGTLYGGRDLRPVLRALRVFLDRHPERAAQGPALRIAGALDDPVSREAFRREVAVLGLGDQVVELGVLSRAEALQLASKARLALVLAQGQELQVPGKLYELVAMGVPTLVIGARDGAASSEARRIGATALEPADCVGMVEMMEGACLGALSPPTRRGVSVDYRELASHLGPILRPSPPKPTSVTAC